MKRERGWILRVLGLDKVGACYHITRRYTVGHTANRKVNSQWPSSGREAGREIDDTSGVCGARFYQVCVNLSAATFETLQNAASDRNQRVSQVCAYILRLHAEMICRDPGRPNVH